MVPLALNTLDLPGSEGGIRWHKLMARNHAASRLIQPSGHAFLAEVELPTQASSGGAQDGALTTVVEGLAIAVNPRPCVYAPALIKLPGISGQNFVRISFAL